MSLKSLQEKIGVTADGAFGPGTLKAAMAFYKLTPARAAHFFAQTAHETGEYKLFSENLNYSALGLMKTWSSRFPDLETADKYAHNPEKIANKVYAGRMGNIEEGDGWKFHGRGLIQLTGRENYANFGLNASVDVLSNPDLLTTPEYATLSAGWYWNKRNLNQLADNMDIEGITKKINGGTLGLEDRKARTQKVLAILQQGG
jgi:putative chitinase